MARIPGDKIPLVCGIPKIKNGTKLTLGRGVRNLTITTDQHLNLFQKTDDEMVLRL